MTDQKQKYHFPRACVIPADGGPPPAFFDRQQNCFVFLARWSSPPSSDRVTSSCESVSLRIVQRPKSEQSMSLIAA